MRSDHISTGRISNSELAILNSLVNDIVIKLSMAQVQNGSFNSAHEGYSVILEELDELWEEVRKKTKKRSQTRMRAECIDIAAAAIRFALDICKEANGAVKATVR